MFSQIRSSEQLNFIQNSELPFFIHMTAHGFTAMDMLKTFAIRYRIRGKQQEFTFCAKNLCAVEALYLACLHSGIYEFPGPQCFLCPQSFSALAATVGISELEIAPIHLNIATSFSRKIYVLFNPHMHDLPLNDLTSRKLI